MMMTRQGLSPAFFSCRRSWSSLLLFLCCQLVFCHAHLRRHQYLDDILHAADPPKERTRNHHLSTSTSQSRQRQRNQDFDAQVWGDLIREITDLIHENPGMASKFLRLGFHDCIGGCDGCVQVWHPDHVGLELPIYALDGIVQSYSPNISRADIWALAALIGAQEAAARKQTKRGVNFLEHFAFGRVDCDDDAVPTTTTTCVNRNGQEGACHATGGPSRRPFPASSEMHTHALLAWFQTEFDLTPRETTALMGAHSLGTAAQINSGYSGPNGWTHNNNVLDNTYYANLVGGTNPGAPTGTLLEDGPEWDQQEVEGGPAADKGDPLHQWVNYDVPRKELMMLNCDVSLVRDFSEYMDPVGGKVQCDFHRTHHHDLSSSTGTPCPFASETIRTVADYKNDNELWLQEFQAVLTKVLEHGYEPPLAGSCGPFLCELGDRIVSD